MGQPLSPSGTNSCQEEEKEEGEGEEEVCLGVEEYRHWEVDPCVPKTNEELWTKLAKLYAGHVKVPSS